LDRDFNLILSKYLEDYLSEEAIEKNFMNYRGRQIRLPEKFSPEADFLAMHRKEIFLG